MKTRTGRSKNRAARQKGAAMVEGALVFLSLMGMIIFVMDVGRMLFMMQYTNERARAGARYAAVHTYNEATIKNFILYNSASAPGGWSQNDGSDRPPPMGLMGLTMDKVAVNRLGVGTSQERIQVRISGIQMALYTPLMAGNYTVPPAVVTIPAEGMGATN